MSTIYILQYIQKALEKAEYSKDENGVIVAKVPNADGFFAQGDNFEEARKNLRDVIEGNIVVALQLNFPIPKIGGLTIERVKPSRDKQFLATPKYA